MKNDLNNLPITVLCIVALIVFGSVVKTFFQTYTPSPNCPNGVDSVTQEDHFWMSERLSGRTFTYHCIN